MAEYQYMGPDIYADGKIYRLTNLTQPFGLLPKVVQDALRDWPHGVERYMTLNTSCSRAEWRDAQETVFSAGSTYRAKPAPARVECYRGITRKTRENGTCIKRPDGSIDWSTWKPEQ